MNFYKNFQADTSRNTWKFIPTVVYKKTEFSKTQISDFPKEMSTNNEIVRF